MLAHLLAAALAQAPSTADPHIAVVVTQRSGISVERAELLTQKIADALVARGVDVKSGPKDSAAALAAAGVKNGGADCQGKRGCVSGLARVLRTWGVVGVELADLDGTLAVHLELIDADKGEPHAELDMVLQAKKAESEIGAQVLPVVTKLKEALEAARPPPPAMPAPVEAVAAPTPAPAPASELVTKPEGSLAPPVVTLAAGVGLGAVSVTFLLLAGQARSTLMAAGFDVTRAQAQGIANRANTDYTVALGCGIGAAALLVLGVVLLVAR